MLDARDWDCGDLLARYFCNCRGGRLWRCLPVDPLWVTDSTDVTGRWSHRLGIWNTHRNSCRAPGRVLLCIADTGGRRAVPGLHHPVQGFWIGDWWALRGSHLYP